MEDFRIGGIDRFGRNYPAKLLLKNGDTVIGQIAMERHESGGKYSIGLFKIIENLEDWTLNKIQFGTRKVSIDGEDILEISTYQDY